MLPPPEDLDRYAHHLPDAAERLLIAAEREQAHRHQLEDHLARMRERALPHEHARHQRARLITLVLGLAYLSVMAIAITTGHALIGTTGAALGTTALLTRISTRLDVMPSGARASCPRSAHPDV